MGARQEEPAWYPTSIPGRPWHTSRDRGVRAVRADEQLVPGDISVDGKVQADGSITPWEDDASASRPTLGQLSPDLQPAMEDLGAALDAADFAEALDGDTWYYEQGGADDTAAYMYWASGREPLSAKHEHIWTTTSPMRCVECRRYFTPWWRRVRDRIRIWRWTR